MTIVYNDQCYARISGLIFGIILFALFLFYMIERILRYEYNYMTGFSAFSYRRVIFEAINLCMMAVCIGKVNLNTAQLTIYSIGIVVSSSSLIYILLLEDMYPYLLLDPFVEFHNGLSFERYVLMIIDASNNSGSNDIFLKLGITNKEILNKRIDKIQSRLLQRRRNLKRIIFASLPMALVNFFVFWINLAYFCDDSPSYTVDLSCVMCIILIMAHRSDWLAILRDDFNTKFSETTSNLQKTFKPKPTLKLLTKKFIRLRRFGFVLPDMIQNDDKYQYSHVHYEAKQYVEDLVEESMNLYSWFENKLEHDEKRRVFSEGIEASLSANQDLRLPVTVTCKIVAEDFVKRACPPHDQKSIGNLSNMILFVTSKVLTRLTRHIADVDYSVINFDLVRRDLVQLIILIVIQSEFDKKEHTHTQATSINSSFLETSLSPTMSIKIMKNQYSKLGLLERIDCLLATWVEAVEAPNEFYKMFHLVNIESGDDDGRAHQILYLNDVFFQDNTSYLNALTIKEFVVDYFMPKIYKGKVDLSKKFDELFENLLLEDIHLSSIFKSGSRESEATEVTEVDAGLEQDTLKVDTCLEEDPRHFNTTESSVAKASKKRIVQKDNAINPFTAQKSKLIENNINSISKESQRTALEISKNDESKDQKKLVSLKDSKASDSDELPETSEHLSFFEFWFRESFTLKVIRWIDWNRTVAEVLRGMAESSIWVLKYLGETCKYLFYTGPRSLLVDACNGSIFTRTYWYHQYMTSMHKLPPSIAHTFLHWGSTQTTQILINPFFTALVAGIISWRFFSCVVHVGSPNFNYNKGVIVLVVLVPFLVMSMPKHPFTDFKNWYPVLLPMSAMILGGFITLATCSDDLDSTTYLGLPARYDLTDVPQSFVIPVVYGIMHAALALFGLLPITMCRLSMKKIMDLPIFGETLAKLLGIHDLYFNHRMLGYLLMSFILIGGILWWLGNDDTAARACTAFYPEGNYFDVRYAELLSLMSSLILISSLSSPSSLLLLLFSSSLSSSSSSSFSSSSSSRGPPWFCESPSETSRFRNIWLNYSECVVHQNGNGQAVLFLREIVVLLLVIIITTSEFKYPTLLNVPPAKDSPPKYYDEGSHNNIIAKVYNDFVKFKYKLLLFFHKCFVTAYKAVVEPNEFEVFIYTHIIATYILAIAAFFSRFEVFYGAAVCWAWYFLDKLYIIIFCTHRFRFSRDDSELFEGAMKIVLVKRHGLPWKSNAGEICHLQVPKLGRGWLGRQWHPFSLAYSNSNDVKAYNDSIEFLMQVQRKNSWTHGLKQMLFDDMHIMTKPVTFFVRGPFGSSFDGYRNNEVIMLIGGGSGIASSLSVLRELCAFRGNVKKCWFIFAARNFSSVQWTWNAINQVLHPSDALHSPSGFIRISIHVSARLTPPQEQFVKNNGALKYIYRPGRPDWKKLFRSFGAQSIGVSGPKKVKICACANKAIYADINRALVECNNPNLTPEFSSENFE